MAIRGEEQAERSQMVMARQEDSTVMLSAAKHLDAHPDRPFAALRVTPSGTLCHARQTLRCAQSLP